MKILIAASEAFPFCKTGGLADVTGALAQVFSRGEGSEVVLFLPRYRNVGGGAFSPKATGGSFLIPVGGRMETATMSRVQWGKVAVYFIENPKFFDRPGIYRTAAGDYEDNDERFLFFSRAVLEGAKFIGFKPDVIHCHDWQTGLVPAYLRTLYRIDSFFAKTASVFTIHNIAYQGMFGKETLLKAGFSWLDFTPERLEFYGGVNYMKSALVFADLITTVSPTYASEIQYRPEFGHGLEGVLKHRTSDLFGILNGIDEEIWDPATDTFLERGYELKSFQRGKAAAKKALQKELGLEENKDLILAGVVSRLDQQKGLDVLLKAAPDFVDKMQFVVLGAGDPGLADAFGALAAAKPKRVAFKTGMDEALAHKIYGASDIFLMPSRFEPCGLSQMISMRYGALPVVTRTGGLKDTVFYNGEPKDSNGFAIDNADPAQLHSVLGHIVSLYGWRENWNMMVRNAMRGDFAWGKSAEAYLKLFNIAVQRRQL
ncbi:MAG: glycogen synthase GlgA [Elusimicrobiales bacterium]|nr:glycogen synthase GlgA [Elusimicrobiales bacterium]